MYYMIKKIRIMKKFKFGIQSLVLLGLLLSGVARGQERQLDRYLILAASNNPGLQAKFNTYMAALQKVPQEEALPNPTLAFSYFIQPVETRLGPQQFKLSASQMFPWFGTLKARGDAATLSAKAGYEEFENYKSLLFYQVKAHYFNLYFAQKATDITIENLELLNTMKNLALIKVEAGLVSAVDEYRIEMEIADQENQLAFLRDKYYAWQVAFNKLLNVNSTDQVQLPEELWQDDLDLKKDVLLDSIIAANHELKKLNFQYESLKFGEKAAFKSGLPGFAVGVDYINIGNDIKGNNGKDALMLPMIGISIPLYRDKYKAMVEEVVLLEKAKQNETSDKKNILEAVMENTWKDYRDAGRRIDLYNKQKDLASKSIQLLMAEYTNNSKNFEEILRMERMYLKYALEYEKALSDKQGANAFVNYLLGR